MINILSIAQIQVRLYFWDGADWIMYIYCTELSDVWHFISPWNLPLGGICLSIKSLFMHILKIVTVTKKRLVCWYYSNNNLSIHQCKIVFTVIYGGWKPPKACFPLGSKTYWCKNIDRTMACEHEMWSDDFLLVLFRRRGILPRLQRQIWLQLCYSRLLSCAICRGLIEDHVDFFC